MHVPRNRSAPPSSVIPVLTYPDVADAVEWLTYVFGFVEHVRIADHRAQLGFGDGAVIVADASNGRRPPGPGDMPTHSVMVRVDDLNAHFQATRAAGATILSAPTDHSYGERQYAVIDPAGHHWTFTQSIADTAPEEWGGSTVTPW
ncbi:MAG: VOC family protein [Pseudonocardia sp.]|nr:VOC family protein [Pseudonocardia sp.]